MPADMAVLTADLAAESAELYEVLSVLAEPDWARETPAVGWTLRDQVAHLAFFDDAAVLSATDPQRFTRVAQRVSREKPILVVKGSRHAERARSQARSQTAAALRDDAAFDAVLHQAGVQLDAWTMDIGKPSAEANLPALVGSGVDMLTTNTPHALADTLRQIMQQPS